MESYSVLMSVYSKENPSFLRSSIQSMMEQTAAFHDFVLVCDGPLNQELDNVISAFTDQSSTFTVIRLPENRGLGPALNAGLIHCQCDLVARMDSDDLSLPDRCSRQLKCFADHPELSMVSGFVREFDTDPQSSGKCRKVPEHTDEIRNFAKQRNPFNHPCVMFRKSHVLSVGGYPTAYPYFEDYALWIRLLSHGASGYNIQAPLLLMRADKKMYARRGGRTHFLSAKKLYFMMLSEGFITHKQYYTAIVIRLVSDFMPDILRQWFYQHLLRR